MNQNTFHENINNPSNKFENLSNFGHSLHVKHSNIATKTKIKVTQIRNEIDNALQNSGERDRLKEILRERLIQSGWRDELKHKCKEIIQNKGLEKITVEQLIDEITPFARSTVPENIKSQLLAQLRDFIQNQLQQNVDVN